MSAYIGILYLRCGAQSDKEAHPNSVGLVAVDVHAHSGALPQPVGTSACGGLELDHHQRLVSSICEFRIPYRDATRICTNSDFYTVLAALFIGTCGLQCDRVVTILKLRADLRLLCIVHILNFTRVTPSYISQCLNETKAPKMKSH